MPYSLLLVPTDVAIVPLQECDLHGRSLVAALVLAPLCERRSQKDEIRVKFEQIRVGCVPSSRREEVKVRQSDRSATRSGPRRRSFDGQDLKRILVRLQGFGEGSFSSSSPLNALPHGVPSFFFSRHCCGYVFEHPWTSPSPCRPRKSQNVCTLWIIHLAELTCCARSSAVMEG